MGSVLTQTRERLGLVLPWLSWLLDLPSKSGGDEWRCRVYGHRLSGVGSEQVNGALPEHRWMSATELEEAASNGQLECGGQEQTWLRMWQNEADAEGYKVTRTYGLPTTHVDYFKYNRGGNPQGHYRVGVFDSDGIPPAPPAKLE